jgi:hypothetical protein
MPRLIDRLRQRAAQGFVGREAELQVLRDSLRSDPPGWPVLLLHGPGGIGKTALLARMADLATQAGLDTLHLDGRDIEPTPGGFTHALALALALPQPALPGALHEALARSPPRLLMVDTFEKLQPLEPWLRSEFLPAMPERLLTVIAGRQAPQVEWRTDRLWSRSARVIALHPLTDGETERWLSAHGVPQPLRARAGALAAGYPLALTLIADIVRSRGDLPERLGADVLGELAGRFITLAPTPAHRAALEVLAMARRTTEWLLAEALPGSDAAALFDWLQALNFVERGPQGLLPHDLMREATLEELRVRNPEHAAALRQTLRRVLHARVIASPPDAVWTPLCDLQFLHHGSPMARYFDMRALGSQRCRPATAADAPGIAALMREELAPEVFAQLEHWLGHPAAHAWVAGAGSVDALVLFIDPDHPQARDRLDAGTRQVVQQLDRVAPLPAGQQRFVSRCNLVRGGKPLQDRHLANPIQGAHWYLWHTTPGLQAWALVLENPEGWNVMMSFLGFAPLAGAAWHAAGTPVGSFWRNFAPATVGATASANSGFAAAGDLVEPLREALRLLADDSALARNPLAKTAWLQAQRRAPESAAQALRRLLGEQARALAEHPREQRLWRALEATFFRPAPTQELAAERLGLPFGTYRYQLRTGVERLAERLWRQMQLH